MQKKVILFYLCIVLACSLDNGLGLTPQMGWNSWNHFHCSINQTLIQQTADRLVSTGLAAKGYVYLNLDDCWQLSRNATTKQIVEDHRTFPSGMKKLSDYVHSKGLKFGLYSDAGEKTCQGRPGGLGYEAIDAKTYAKWEQEICQYRVDYLKYDNCHNKNVSGKLRYHTMYKALNQSGRAIFYSMCNWGQQKSWQWAEPMANSWRTTGDISDKWSSFLSILDQQVDLSKYAGKGGWNDPDMLEVGNGGMKFEEYYSHFALWCILKAPLLIGCDLNKLSNETLTILGNEELIAINQDSLGKQGIRIKRQVKTSGTVEIWGGNLANNKFVIAFLNRAEQKESFSLNLKSEAGLSFKSYTKRDAIEHIDLGSSTEEVLTATVSKHSVQVYVITLEMNESQKIVIE